MNARNKGAWNDFFNGRCFGKTTKKIIIWKKLHIKKTRTENYFYIKKIKLIHCILFK